MYRFLASTLVPVLVLAGCTLQSGSYSLNLQTGPIQTVNVNVPLPEDPSALVFNVEFIAGDLTLSPGADGSVAQGTATYNAADLAPVLESNGSSVTLKAGEKEIKGIPKCGDGIKNAWALQVSNLAMSLNIKAGAYDGEFELGGIALKSLFIDEAGSDVTISFSEPNLVEMSSFTYYTGGSTMRLNGLANANTEKMIFQSGAGDYTLSFDGELQRDMEVNIDSGAASVNIIVPPGVNTKLTFLGGLTGIEMMGNWVKNGDVYSQPGEGPVIQMNVSMGMGSLNLLNE